MLFIYDHEVRLTKYELEWIIEQLKEQKPGSQEFITVEKLRALKNAAR